MITRELRIFLVVGCLAVLVDFCAYRSLIWLGITGVDTAKALGFLSGTVLSYTANRHWTFAHQPHAPGSLWRFAALYAATLGLNVLINASALTILAGSRVAVQTAFLLATGISAATNFLGMKVFVFKARNG
jgi:putative flippase GtrA